MLTDQVIPTMATSLMPLTRSRQLVAIAVAVALALVIVFSFSRPAGIPEIAASPDDQSTHPASSSKTPPAAATYSLPPASDELPVKQQALKQEELKEEATPPLFEYVNHQDAVASNADLMDQGQPIAVSMEKLVALQPGDSLLLPVGSYATLTVTAVTPLANGHIELTLASEENALQHAGTVVIADNQVLGEIITDDNVYALEAVGGKGWMLERKKSEYVVEE